MKKKKFTLSAILLFPFSLLYQTGVELRNLFFEWGLLSEKQFDLPVISVGNITVGGTGKTPHIEYLVELLKDEFSVATLSRGYRRKTRHFMVASENSKAADIGDEPKQLKQKYPGIMVAVDRERVNGIQQILKLSEQVDVVLLDDAFQHRYVRPGKSILLIDYNRMIQDDLLLPAGRLREPASGRKRADIILVTKSPSGLKPIEMRNIVKQLKIGLHQHLFFTTIEYGDLSPVFPALAENKTPAGLKKEKVPLLILTGIANPRPIRKFARSISTNLHEITYPDHHAFTSRDLEKIYSKYKALNKPEAIILTTEKDAMRLKDLEIDEVLKKVIYFVPIHVKFLNNDTEEFNKLIVNYVRSNQRNNILHQRKNRTANA